MTPVALITGAGRGIGRAMAERLVADGMQVMLTDRDLDALKETQKFLIEQGGNVDILQADLSDSAATEEIIPAVIERFGRIDALILNAAHHGERISVLKTSTKDWQDIFAVNLFAGAALCRAAARDMAQRGQGSIVTIGSVQARLPAPSYAAYVSSKAAIEGMTRAFAVELAELGIRVNCIAPGVIGTENYASNLKDLAVDGDAPSLASLSGNAGTPAQVADAVSFLCAPGSAFITGIVLPVDGGRSISRRADPFQISLDHMNN